MRAVTRELIETAILALLIFVLLQFSVQNFRVEGSSMDPTLEGGEYLLVNKLVYARVSTGNLRGVLAFTGVESGSSIFPFHPPLHGEVLIFRFPRDPSRDFVKRVIGVPGDTVEIQHGEVFVNGQKLQEPYVTHRDLSHLPPTKVPAGHYFVLGDNRRASNDSRDWGPVPEENIIGRAWLRYWPLGRWHAL